MEKRDKDENEMINAGDIVGIAYYRREDWRRLLEISEDRAELESTWQEWEDGIDRYERFVTAKGVVCHRIQIDLVELLEYCRLRGMPVDGVSRAEYSAEKTRAAFGE